MTDLKLKKLSNQKHPGHGSNLLRVYCVILNSLFSFEDKKTKKTARELYSTTLIRPSPQLLQRCTRQRVGVASTDWRARAPIMITLITQFIQHLCNLPPSCTAYQWSGHPCVIQSEAPSVCIRCRPNYQYKYVTRTHPVKSRMSTEKEACLMKLRDV